MSATLLVRGARQLVTLRGPSGPRRGKALSDLGIIADGAVLIEDFKIVEAGPSRRVENLAKARGAEEIDATGRVVMPGFVDCHTHLVCGHPWLDDYEARIAGANEEPQGPASSLNAAQRSSAARLEAQARHLVAAMTRHGTTTVEAKSGHGFSETGELKILRVHRRLHQAPVDLVSTFLCAPLGGGTEYLEWISTELLSKIWRLGLARFADFHAEDGRLPAAQVRTYLEAARSLGFRLKVHSGENAPDEGVSLAVAFEAASADHLDFVSASDVDLLARSNTMAVLLPGISFQQARDRFAPARALIDAGAAVSLATGFHPGASPTLSMQTVVMLACRCLHMTPAEALCAATFNAACAIGYGERTGSLEVGKSADLIILDVADYRELAYYYGVNLVHTTIKRGRLIRPFIR